ncbi:disease resistance protein UNI-like [Dioscorea cayenensis subsp. rotundata]|uniref:Disease resistance protein UNI-like n=1 Tax=Dioscorea cayennensis subsp. rotundata TaxID=55577 RepID=A0AB40CJ61_DIOCR|nr:disease resistance protein UNI-like [Dioscorea cayenensis subsp. rotundata]
MDFLITIAGVIVNHTWVPISRQFGYLISYKRNIKKLEIKFDELDALRQVVQGKVDAARHERLEEVNTEVQTWLTKVNTMEEEVKRIKDKASLISNNCFLPMNLHYKLGREAAHHKETTVCLIRTGNFDCVSHPCPPPSTTDSLSFNGDYAIFNSRKSNEEKILEALKDEAVHSIGLWGMRGVGRTTLVKEVVKQAKGLFGRVVMVTASQNIDLNRFQTDIANSLGLFFEEDRLGLGLGLGLGVRTWDSQMRVFKLEKKLRDSKKKVLVIFHDLQETFNLSSVGIKLPQMGTNCKVVITARNKYVCYGMKCQEIVEMRALTEEESWSLFRSRAGDEVESPTMKELARNVARECAGLPLALVFLVTTLKGKSPEIWNTMLERLRGSMEVDLPCVSKQVFQSIQLSFDLLESEAAKSCFLHCCLYPEDKNIPNNELMHMMVGGGLLTDVETLNEAQSRVDQLLERLKACGLLLQDMYIGCVRMPDVVRDVATSLCAKDHTFYVGAAGRFRAEWPRHTESEMQNCRRLSLMHSNIADLPPDPMEYPKLETLILRDNRWLSSIPEMFFLHMGSLMVLDLSSTNISSLPKSLSCLTNLRVFNLRNCRFLKDISHINGLKMLEMLDLEGSPVSIAPEGVGWAQNVRFINLRCHIRFLMPPSLDDYFSKVLPRFHRLEQLFMDKFAGSFRELLRLRHLTHLFITEAVDLDDPISHEPISPGSWPDGLLNFSLSFLQDRKLHFFVRNKRRCLKLMGTKPLAVWAKRLLETTITLVLTKFQETELISLNSDIPWLALSSLENLKVVKWQNLTKLLGDELSLHEEMHLSQLKKMTIDNCPRLTGLIPTSLWRSMQKLEHLKVKHCPMMLELFPCDHKIENCQEMSEMPSSCTSLQAPCYFQGLRKLKIRSCPRLRHLFSDKQAKNMQHLIELSITDCAALKTVVISTENKEEASASTSTHVADHESDNSPFPNLRQLVLYDLPQLTAFHHLAATPMGWSGLHSCMILGCPKLEPSAERIQLIRARKNKAGGVKAQEEEGKEEEAGSAKGEEEEAGDLEPDW